MASPSGVPPIPDISSRLMTPSIVFSFVTPLFVALRVASRVRFTKRLGRDDWTIVISCVSYSNVKGLTEECKMWLASVFAGSEFDLTPEAGM
ncbi:integral membrane protein [Histoplasma capsulatum G186AR]|uniref:Integral membrane protein n=1 Tax=Ajellomyces capsulatus TaxID=5037 RepID=A0A8H8CVD4_AJECA|nr:integral membrane protein [Histoplasma capsulatum]QSS68412.1 integral membrane protein [Histoplasma capsulatum G186AR]